MGEKGVVFLIFRDVLIVSDVCSIVGVGYGISTCRVARFECMASAGFVFKPIAKLQLFFQKIKSGVIKNDCPQLAHRKGRVSPRCTRGVDCQSPHCALLVRCY